MRRIFYFVKMQRGIIGYKMNENIIKDVRAKVYTWTGDIQKIHGNFCTNAADILNNESTSSDNMSTFKFLSWLVV